MENILDNLTKTLSIKQFSKTTGNYYNHTSMHSALGYNTYHSISEIITEADPKDITIVLDDTTWDLLMNKREDGNFFDFVITFCPHLPYNSENKLGRYVLN